MECPYISVSPNRKICGLMAEQGLDGELDNFDITHYCNGNPDYCFFFRSNHKRTRVTESPEENQPNAPSMPITSIMLNELIQHEGPSSKQSDKLLKLKRFLHRTA